MSDEAYDKPEKRKYRKFELGVYLYDAYGLRYGVEEFLCILWDAIAVEYLASC